MLYMATKKKEQTIQEEPTLNPIKVKGRIKILKALLYKSHMIYIRMIDAEIFEYLLEYNGEIYSSYIIITPEEGKTELTEGQIAQSAALILAGGTATLDALLGHKVDDQTKEILGKFEEGREFMEGQKDAKGV